MTEYEHNEEDVLITVTMPLRDYKVLREIIDDRKSTVRFLSRVKHFSLMFSGVVAAWYFLGEKFIKLLVNGATE